VSKDIQITSNAKEFSKAINNYAKWLKDKALKSVLRAGLDVIGNRVVQNHMIMTRNLEEAFTFPVDDFKLTVRSGRLSGSAVGRRMFSYTNFAALDKSTMEIALSNRKFTFPSSIDMGGKSEAIREVKVGAGKIIGKIGTETPYAATHEFGDMDRGIKERESWQPAITESKDTIVKMFRNEIIVGWNKRIKTKMNK